MWLDLRNSQVYRFLSEVRAARPTVSMPDIVTDEILADQEIAPVVIVQQPPHDPMTQNVIELAPVQLNDAWTQQWSITDASDNEKSERLAARRERMVVTPFQAKAALFNAGLLDDVERLISAAETSTLTKLAWANAVEWRRTSPMLAELAAALNITDTQLDDLFIAAAAIVA